MFPDLVGSNPGAILQLDVDGVDVAGGRLTGPSETILDELLGGLCELAAGTRSDLDVSFAEGAYELVLGVSGRRALLSLASLRRPAGLVFQDLEVDFEELVEAAIDCARDWLETEDRAAEGTAGASGRSPAGRLRDRLRQLARLRRSPARPEDPPEIDPEVPALVRREELPRGGEADAPSFGFSQLDPDGRIHSYRSGSGLHALLAPGHVHVYGPDGEELASVPGSPFLLLRDLSDAAWRMLEGERTGATAFRLPLGAKAPPLEVDIKGGAFTLGGRTLRCPPSSVAIAIFSALLDLGGVIRARNPRLAASVLLASAVQDARMRLALCDERIAGPQRPSPPPPTIGAGEPRSAPAEPPIAPGTLRRVAIREAWRRELPGVLRVHAAGDEAWIVHAEGATRLRLHDGTTVAELGFGSITDVAMAGESLLALDGGALSCHGADGALLWRRSAGFAGLGAAWSPPRADLVWLQAEGGSLVAVERRTGAERFRLSPPAAHAGLAAASGALIVLAADNGMAYGIDAAAGAVAWRVPLPWEPSGVTVCGGTVFLAGTVRGRVILQGLDARTGEASFTAKTSLLRLGAIVPDARGAIAAGPGASVTELVRVDAGGRLRWTLRPNLGAGSPSVSRAGGGLYARGAEGVARIERGRVRWNTPCQAGGAPVAIRGVLALPGETLRLLDTANGRPLLPARGADPFPAADHVIPAAAGTLVVADAAGTCASLRLTGALAVV